MEGGGGAVGDETCKLRDAQSNTCTHNSSEEGIFTEVN